MVVLLVLGFAAYFQLGQDEDPPFTFRAMVVQAFWPGATAQQMAEQVTDKIEKTLQEVPYADKIRSYTKPGESLTILQVKDSSPPKEVPADLVPGAQEDRRHARHAAGRRDRARSSTTSSATSTARSTRCRPTASATRSCASYADHVRQRLLRVPDVTKVEIFGAQAEKVFIEISQKRLAQLGPGLQPGARAARRAERGRGGRRAQRRRPRTCRCASAGSSTRSRSCERFPIRAVNPAPARPARCAWATSPRSSAPTSTRRR